MFKNELTTESSMPYEAASLKLVKRRGGKFDVYFMIEDSIGSRYQRIVSNRVLSIAIEEAVDALLGLQIELNRGRLKLNEQKAEL